MAPGAVKIHSATQLQHLPSPFPARSPPRVCSHGRKEMQKKKFSHRHLCKLLIWPWLTTVVTWIRFEGLVASSLVPSIMTTVVQSHTSLNHYKQWSFVMKPAFKTSSASISASSKIQAIEQKFLFNSTQPLHSYSSKIVKTHNRKTGIQRQPQTAMPISYRCGNSWQKRS